MRFLQPHLPARARTHVSPSIGADPLADGPTCYRALGLLTMALGIIHRYPIVLAQVTGLWSSFLTRALCLEGPLGVHSLHIGLMVSRAPCSSFRSLKPSHVRPYPWAGLALGLTGQGKPPKSAVGFIW